MRQNLILLCGLLTCSMLLGCPSPQQSTSYPLEADKKLLPADWLALSPDDSHLKYLSPTTVELLFDLKNEIAQSRNTPEGTKPPMSEALIAQRSREMNTLCNNEMLTSSEIWRSQCHQKCTAPSTPIQSCTCATTPMSNRIYAA